MKLPDSDSEAGGCILIVTNLPNAYVADSSVAGCIFSLIQNIFSLLFFDTVLRLKLAKLPLQQTGSDTKSTLFIGKLQCLIMQKLWRAKTNN